MVLDYYNLREQPFGVTSDPGFLYLSPTHREALSSLAYGIQSGRGFMSLVAKPGMGKTTILFRLLDQLKKSTHTVYLFQTLCRGEDLLRALLHDLGINDNGGDVVRMQAQLNSFLFAVAREGRKIVVVVDEAQNLEDPALELLRMLSNFETTTEKLMQIILAGQPQFGERLASPQLLQLRQRMSIIARLKDFDAEETRHYIAHRLRVAGYDFKTALFTREAEALIARRSDGIPRNINNICFNALSLGWVLKQRTIGKEVVHEVVQDLSIEGDEVLQDRELGRKLFGWMARQPETACHGRLGWRKRLAAGVVLLLPLLSFSSGRGREAPAPKPFRASMEMISKSPVVAASADSLEGASLAVMSGPSPASVQSQAKSATIENPATTSAVVTRPAAVSKLEPEIAIVSAASVPVSRPTTDPTLHLPRKDMLTPDELWAQVKNKNRDAEMQLARMYLDGTSVPRNCAQAQILLQDVSRHGNAHAIDLLNNSQCH